MTHFDTFSGYGGFSIALERCGIETMGFSEVDKNANAVLKYHWPNIINYGDITTITDLPDFDVLTGGSPCQDFSIAGKREGLGGARSSLAWEFIRILRLKKPKYFIWENVKGVMSSRSGWDFANIISAFSESGYSLWWQVLNAKNFGVPQNRERIFVVGFRDGSPKEVFFKRQDSETTAVIPTLTSRYYGGQANGAYIRNKPKQIIEGRQGSRVYDPIGISQSLTANTGGKGGKTGLYAVPLKFLDRNQKNFQGEYAFTVDGSQTGGIMIDPYNQTIPQDQEATTTLRTNYANGNPQIMNGRQIRRLTPTECERLMGLPDNWTAKGVNEKGEYELSDSARYKLCGNGVVVNCVEAIVKNLLISLN